MLSAATDSHNGARCSGGDLSGCVFACVTATSFKVEVVGRLKDATESNSSLSGLWPALLADVPNYSGRCEWNTCPDFTCGKFCLLWMT